MTKQLTKQARARMSQGGRRASHEAKVTAGKAGYRAMIEKLLAGVKPPLRKD